jgi:hypothetical protein
MIPWVGCIELDAHAMKEVEEVGGDNLSSMLRGSWPILAEVEAEADSMLVAAAYTCAAVVVEDVREE